MVSSRSLRSAYRKILVALTVLSSASCGGAQGSSHARHGDASKLAPDFRPPTSQLAAGHSGRPLQRRLFGGLFARWIAGSHRRSHGHDRDLGSRYGGGPRRARRAYRQRHLVGFLERRQSSRVRRRRWAGVRLGSHARDPALAGRNTQSKSLGGRVDSEGATCSSSATTLE